MTTDNEELWYVQMDNGELREVTLDELDTAFNAGLIHENTFVMEVNGTEWQTLADVAGLNEEEPAPPAPAYAPQSAGLARPLPQLAPAARQWPPATSAAMSASAWPPVVAATPAYAPRSAPAHMPYNLQSTAPVVHDLSDLDLNPPFKRRGTGKWVAMVAVLVLGGVGFAGHQMKMLPKFQFTKPEVPAGVTAAMTLPRSEPEPKPAATTPPAPSPTPPPATTAKEEKADEEKEKAKSLTEEVKEKLLSADKTRVKERKSKRAARASKASRRGGRAKKGDGSSPFRGGGSSSDPLNSKL